MSNRGQKVDGDDYTLCVGMMALDALIYGSTHALTHTHTRTHHCSSKRPPLVKAAANRYTARISFTLSLSLCLCISVSVFVSLSLSDSFSLSLSQVYWRGTWTRCCPPSTAPSCPYCSHSRPPTGSAPSTPAAAMQATLMANSLSVCSCMCVCLCVCMSVGLSVCLPVCLPVCLRIYLRVSMYLK